MAAKTVAGGEQLSLLELLEEDQEDILELCCQHGSGYEGCRVRTYAMLASGMWPQYRERWLRDEFGNGGYSIPGLRGWFCEHSADGLRMRNLRSGAEHHASWRQVLIMIMRLIDQGDYLTRAEERELERIVQASQGKIPFPRPRLRYPEDAWRDPREVRA